MIHFCRIWAVRCGDEEAWRQGHHSGSENPSAGLRYRTHACLGTKAELHLSEPLSLIRWSTWTYVWGMLRMKLPLTKKPFVLFLSRFNLFTNFAFQTYPVRISLQVWNPNILRSPMKAEDYYWWCLGLRVLISIMYKVERWTKLSFPISSSLSCL